MLNQMHHVPSHGRRRFLAVCGRVSIVAGGVAILGACDDDIVESSDVVAAQPSGTPTPTSTAVPPAYTATDNDRLNLLLQLHYLAASYMHQAVIGSPLPTSLTTGTGTAGTATGARTVTIAAPLIALMMREATMQVVQRITLVRRTLGTATTAMPPINLSGGQGSAFQALAVRPGVTSPPPPFDPYVSQDEFLLGAVALSAVLTSAANDVAARVGRALLGPMGALAAGIAATDAIIRDAAITRAEAQPLPLPAGERSLFNRSTLMSDARDALDGPSELDEGLLRNDAVNLTMVEDQTRSAMRRSPEQALAVVYASAASVSSGGFFPQGVNGTIRTSGAFILS